MALLYTKDFYEQKEEIPDTMEQAMVRDHTIPPYWLAAP